MRRRHFVLICLWLLQQLVTEEARAQNAGQQPAGRGPRPRQRPRQRPCVREEGFINMCGYETHRQMMDLLKDLERRHPSLAKVGETGRSSEGKSMAYIKISQNVNQRGLLEPMFRYVGNMHGNEVIGRQLLIYLAQYLLEMYSVNPRIARLLNTTELYLMPTMNPDGFAASRAGVCNAPGRNNANDVDLNRDFPRQFDGEGAGVPLRTLLRGKQPETQQLMSWIAQTPFVLSANIHSGAVVASYPFDDSKQHSRNFYSKAPDDEVFKHLAKLYASNHRTMSSGRHCGDFFPGGVTNGAKWYDVPGGMQDFNYVHSNDFEITLELGCCKHPRARKLVEEWHNNKASLLKYMEATHMGIKGIVQNASGRGIPNARVIVEGINKSVSTTQGGEYWRLLTPGDYVVYAKADGYAPGQRHNVRVDGGAEPPRSKRFDITLTSDDPRG